MKNKAFDVNSCFTTEFESIHRVFALDAFEMRNLFTFLQLSFNNAKQERAGIFMK